MGCETQETRLTHWNGADMRRTHSTHCTHLRALLLFIDTGLMSFPNLDSDSRSHASPGPPRNARLQKVTLPGGGFISKGEDGRIAVAGRDCAPLFHISTHTLTPQLTLFLNSPQNPTRLRVLSTDHSSRPKTCSTSCI